MVPRNIGIPNLFIAVIQSTNIDRTSLQLSLLTMNIDVNCDRTAELCGARL